MADLHAALKTEVLDRQHGDGVEVVLVRLQDGRDKVRHSLHARPSTYWSSGLQTTDLLGLIGFQRSQCSFVSGSECYVRAVERDFELAAFAEALPKSRESLQAAERHLRHCGYFLDIPEGLGFFYGRPSEPRGRSHPTVVGDGHTAQLRELMKDVEDSEFRYKFTWLKWNDREKGWTTHIRPIHPPLSLEVEQAFNYIGLRNFGECPEFEFESCHWRFTPWEQQRGGTIFDGNNDVAHGWFDAHSEHFSSGIERLLHANVTLEPFDMRLLPRPIIPPQRPAPVEDADRSQAITVAAPSYEFDVAISFAGTERQYAERLAAITREADFEVFYDRYYEEQLWGKDLPVFFDEIYRKKARFCVIFASSEYIERMWTNHERQSAVARALEERGKEYILPIQVDRVEIPGVPPTVGYLSLAEKTIEDIGEALVKKLRLG